MAGRASQSTTPVYWKVWEIVEGKGHSFLGHVQANTLSNALTLARVKFPNAKLLHAEEYQPS